MTNQEILTHCDHTCLRVDATWENIKETIEDGIRFNVASVCIPPKFVKHAKEIYGDKIKVCTVIGFPNGYSTTEVKVYETKVALRDGADEIDMVINIGLVKERKYNDIIEEIRAIKEVCGEKILKVIIETCLLTAEETIKMGQVVTYGNADYIKTSTGFSKAGAKFEDIPLMKTSIGKNVKIKAAGGIKSFNDAKLFLDLGCDRLGTSSLVKIAKEQGV